LIEGVEGVLIVYQGAGRDSWEIPQIISSLAGFSSVFFFIDGANNKPNGYSKKLLI